MPINHDMISKALGVKGVKIGRKPFGHSAPSLFDHQHAPTHLPYAGVAPFQSKSDTSAAAAEAITPRVSELQVLILGFVRGAGADGLTHEQLGIMLAQHRSAPDLYAYAHRSTAAARATELKLLGFIHDSGKRRKNRSGSTAAVWIASETGETKP